MLELSLALYWTHGSFSEDSAFVGLFNFLLCEHPFTSLLTQSHPVLSHLSIHRHSQYNSAPSALFYIESESESHSVVSDSLQPHGLYSPWNSQCQNTGVGGLSFLQGIFPTQGWNPGLPHCRWILYQLSHKGSPRIWSEQPISSPGHLPDSGINWGLLHCRWILYQLSHQGRPSYIEATAKQLLDVSLRCWIACAAVISGVLFFLNMSLERAVDFCTVNSLAKSFSHF